MLFSPILYDNAALIPVFYRLQSLHSSTDFTSFSSNYASKLIERFPSIIHLELEVYSTDKCKPLLDHFLDGLPKLIHLRIYLRQDELDDYEICSTHYVYQRRRQAFPHHSGKEYEVCTKIEGKIIDIYLSGCSICTKI